MSAFGTKKPGGDLAVQLTFPTIYSDVYADSGANEIYYPASSVAPTEVLPEGHDLQALYHEQKRLDANRMAMAGVRSRKASDVYARAGNAGYGVMPEPVLSQRRYANPSNGNQSDIYAGRYDQLRGAGEMTGGVLRTRTGQQWGKEKLLDRVNQLNAIAEAKAGFLMGQSVDESITPTLVEQAVEPVSSKMMLDLMGALNQFQNQFQTGKPIGAIAVSEFYKALRLLFRVAPMADSETLEDLIVMFDDIYTQYTAMLGHEVIMEGQVSPDERATSVWEIIPKVREYLKKMLGGVNKSAKERRQLSANLLKSLGIVRFVQRNTPTEVRPLEQETRRRMAEYENEAYPPPEDGDWGDNDTGSSSSSSSGGVPPRGRVRFDPSPRANWASRSGAYFGEEYNEDALPTSTAANPMRRMASAQLPTAEGRQRVPVFSDFTEGEAAEAANEAEAEDFTSAPESREDSEHASVSTSALPPLSRKEAITKSAAAAPAPKQSKEARLSAALARFGATSPAQKRAITLAVMNPLMSQQAISDDKEVLVHQTTVSKWLRKAGV